MKVLLLNSGGKDTKLALQIFKQQNPDPTIEIVSFTIEVNDQETLDRAASLAEQFALQHVVLPFLQTFMFIHTLRPMSVDTATSYWNFELFFKAIQYAATNGFDYVMSGTDGRPVNDQFEECMQMMMACTNFGKTISIIRPLRDVKTNEDFQALAATVA